MPKDIFTAIEWLMLKADKGLAYSLVDGFRVEVYHPDEPDTVFLQTNTHEIVHELMALFKFKNESP